MILHLPHFEVLLCTFLYFALCFDWTVDIFALYFYLGVFEVDEGPAASHECVRHVWRLPDHFWLSGPRAGSRRHGFPGTGAAQHHRDLPDQRHQHLHWVPDLPHRLKNQAENRRCMVAEVWGAILEVKWCIIKKFRICLIITKLPQVYQNILLFFFL